MPLPILALEVDTHDQELVRREAGENRRVTGVSEGSDPGIVADSRAELRAGVGHPAEPGDQPIGVVSREGLAPELGQIARATGYVLIGGP
jgi:hypothetical protein